MVAALKKYHLCELMRPGLLGLLMKPFYFALRDLLRVIGNLIPRVEGRLLVVGCGNRPYEMLFQSTEYVGMELDTAQNRRAKHADIYYDGRTFPIEPGSFDAVVCNQVLEHVFEPDAFIGEIARVLKADGKLLLTVPFVWDEHEQPRDFGRYSSYGLTALLERNGFKVMELHKTMGDVRTIFQMLNAYLFKKTQGRNPYWGLVATVAFMAPVNVVGTMLSWITPGNPDLYLDNVVLARKVSDL